MIYVWVFCAFIFAFIIFIFKSNDYSHKNVKKKEIELKHITDNISIFSSFFLKKSNLIKLIGYNKNKYLSNINCKIKYTNQMIRGCNISYSMHKKVNEHFFVIDIRADQKQFLKLIINNVAIFPYVVEDEKNKKNFTLCITKFINYTAVTYLLEAINSYFFIGINHIVIYYLSSSAKVYRILQYYEKLGLMDIVVWNYKYETTVLRDYYYGQIWKYNDCLYRYKSKSKYLVFNDIDEVLWINSSKSLNAIIKEEKLEVYDVLYLYNRIFRKDFFSNKNYSNSRYLPYDRFNHYIPDFSMFSYHNSCTYKKYYLSKYIILNYSKVKYIAIHQVIEFEDILRIKFINKNIIFLRHTRNVREDLLDDCNVWSNYYSSKEVFLSNVSNRIKKIIKI